MITARMRYMQFTIWQKVLVGDIYEWNSELNFIQLYGIATFLSIW